MQNRKTKDFTKRGASTPAKGTARSRSREGKYKIQDGGVYAGQGGQIFTGTISSITEWGMFVELDTKGIEGVEGLVPSGISRRITWFLMRVLHSPVNRAVKTSFSDRQSRLRWREPILSRNN